MALEEKETRLRLQEAAAKMAEEQRVLEEAEAEAEAER